MLWLLKEYLDKDGLFSKYSSDIINCLNLFNNNQSPFAFCFSEKRDLLSQWRGYASDGAGVCIGLNKKNLIEEYMPLSAGFILSKVIYNKETILNNSITQELFSELEKYVEDAFKRLNYGTLVTGKTPDKIIEEQKIEKKNALSKIFSELNKFNRILFFGKNPAFHEEEEWRLLRFIEGEGSTEEMKTFSDQNIRIIESNNAIRPFYSFDIAPRKSQPINEIILGPKNMTNKRTL